MYIITRNIYGLPDFRTCLLNQKLQLLNECIRRKIQHRKYIKFKQERLKQKDKENDINEPEGVEKKHPYLYLLNHPNISINIPITQDHPIFTEDKLESHYNKLVSLGSSMDASKKKSKITIKTIKI